MPVVNCAKRPTSHILVQLGIPEWAHLSASTKEVSVFSSHYEEGKCRVTWNYEKIELYFKNIFYKEFDWVLCIGASLPSPISVLFNYKGQPNRTRPRPKNQTKSIFWNSLQLTDLFSGGQVQLRVKVCLQIKGHLEDSQDTWYMILIRFNIHKSVLRRTSTDRNHLDQSVDCWKAFMILQ